MRRSSLTSAEFDAWLLRWRWQLVCLLSLTAVAIELAEHQPALLHHIDVVVFAAIVPCMLRSVAVRRSPLHRMVEGRKRAVEAERRELARDCTIR